MKNIIKKHLIEKRDRLIRAREIYLEDKIILQDIDNRIAFYNDMLEGRTYENRTYNLT